MQMIDSLQARFLAQLQDFSPSQEYLVGVSGGRDSVALLHLLLQAGYQHLTLCHLNHALRGEHSDGDELFVKSLAGSLGLACVAERVDVLAASQGVSLETAARRERYAFFAKTASQTACRVIFLAHHADDQVETVLFNLFRGSGLKGVCGMRPVVDLSFSSVILRVVRPLLSVWRSEINSYTASRSLPYREDASNTSDAHTRNRLRNQIVPYLEEQLGRNIRHSVWRFAEILSAELNALPEPEELEQAQQKELSVAILRQQNIAEQRRLIYHWLKNQGVKEVGFELVEMARQLILPGCRHAKINLPGNHHLCRRQKRLLIEQPASKSQIAT